MYLIYEPLFLQVLYMCEDFLQEHANLDFYNLVIYFPCSTYLQNKSTMTMSNHLFLTIDLQLLWL